MSAQIVLIDFSSIAHPIWHTTDSEREQNPNAMSTAIVAKVRALASGQPHVALCLDSRKSFRKELSADYKAGREAKPEAFWHQTRLALETLRGDGFPQWESDGFEADDIIGTAVHVAAMKAMLDTGWQMLVVSSDKDLLQLVNDRVQAKNPTSGNVLDEAGVVEKFGVKPHQILDYLTLVGDASDGVKGVPGIGPKGAAAILNTFGNLDDLYAAIDRGEAKLKPASEKAIVEFRPNLALTRQLLTLRTDAPIAFEEVLRERTSAPMDEAVFGEEPMSEMTGDEAADLLGAYVQTKLTDIEQREPVVVTPNDPLTIALNPPILATSSGAVVATSPAPPTGNSAGESARSPVSRGVEATADLVTSDEQKHRNAQEAVREAARRGSIESAAVVESMPAPVEWERQLEPRTMAQAIQLGNLMFQARLFSAYGTPQGVLATILAGRELGLQSMAALRAFQIVEGKPTYSADLIRALVLRSPQCEYFRVVAREATHATWITKRKGDPDPVSLTFTLEEGRAAWQKDQKAWDNSSWGKRPVNMVTKTASSMLARLVYPDVVMNLYCPEEML